MIVDRDEADNLSGGDPRTLRYFFGGVQIGQVGNDGTDNMTYVASIADRLAVQGTSGAFHNGAVRFIATANHHVYKRPPTVPVAPPRRWRSGAWKGTRYCY
jgi:hypothetical protein